MFVCYGSKLFKYFWYLFDRNPQSITNGMNAHMTGSTHHNQIVQVIVRSVSIYMVYLKPLICCTTNQADLVQARQGQCPIFFGASRCSTLIAAIGEFVTVPFRMIKDGLACLACRNGKLTFPRSVITFLRTILIGDFGACKLEHNFTLGTLNLLRFPSNTWSATVFNACSR